MYSVLLFGNNKSIKIISPKENITTINNSFRIRWNNTSNTSQYIIQVANDSSFNTPIVNVTTVNLFYNFNIPVIGSTYYVRVKSKEFNDWSRFSIIKSVNINFTSNKLWVSGENTTSSSSSVSSWNDIVHNNAAQQTVPTNQPKLVNIPLLNNLPALRFNASQPNYLLMSNSVPVSEYNMFTVRSYVSSPSVVQYFLAGNACGFYSDINAFGCGYGGFGLNGQTYSALFLQPKTYSIFEHKPAVLYRNNNQQTICTSGSSSAGAIGMQISCIGTRPDVTALAYEGDIAEIILFDTILNDNTRNIVYDYLKYKYAPPISLGVDTIAGNSFCDSIIISAGNRFVSYLWSTGDTSSSIKVKTSGTYSVLVKDVFGYNSFDEIIAYPYKRLNNALVYICTGDTFKVDLKTPPGFTAEWPNGTNSTKINLTQSGQYTVKITDNRGCFVFDTINIIVDNPKLSIIPVSGNLTACSGEKLFVQTESSFDSIRWSNGSTNNFISVLNGGNYSVQAYTTAGCVLNQSFNVNIAGFAPTANFSTASVCQSTSTQLSDLSIPPSGSTITNWKWNFSNGNSSTSPSPSIIFTNLGTASASLKVTTAQGCTDSIFKTFVVNKRPTPLFVNRKSCEGNPTLFQDQSIANAANITNWKWDFDGLGIINDIQNPAFEFPNANTYNVKLIVTNSNGCIDSVTNSLKVNQSPIADFSFDAACGKSPVNFRFLATVPVAPAPPQPTITTWNWDFGDNQSESSIKDVQHVYGTTGLYNVKLSVTSSEQCVDTLEKQVKIYDFPVVDFDVSATQCVDKEIQFTDISQTPDGTPLTIWKWFFAGEGTASTQNSIHTFNTEGNYTIQLNATNAVGCSGTKLRSIAVSAKPEINFTFSPQNLPAPLDVTYTNQSPTSGNYIWDYGDNTSPLFSGYNPPVHRYLTNGTYPIKLIATNFRGCTDTLTKFILVGKANVDGVMTSISIIPNGDFYKIQVTILNASNIEIRDLGLSLQLGGGAVIRENWTGSLLPDQTTIYNFIGQIKISDNVIPVICASIDNVNNNTPEVRTDNNTTCKEVKVGSFDILNVYPNPAFDVLNLGVMIPNDGKVSVRIVDALGQTFEKKDFNGIKGYNNFTMNTIQLNAAIYIAEVFYDGQVVRTKFMRKDRK
jgi:PKD repeat protein